MDSKIVEQQASKLVRIRSCSIFAHARESDLEALTQIAHRERFSNRELIVSAAGGFRRILLLEEGEVHAFETSGKGDEAVIEIVGPGEIYGLFLLGGGAASTEGVRTDHGALALCFHPPVLRHFLTDHPAVALQVIEALANGFGEFRRRFIVRGVGSVRCRVAQELATEVRRTGDVSVMTGQHQIAGRVGASARAVSYALQYLRERRLVECNPHRPGITVIDLTSLEDETQQI